MPNLLVLALSALIPMIMGFIWYNPKVFGTAWMNSIGKTAEQLRGGNMAVIFIASYVLSFFLAFALQFIVIHQFHIYSTLANEPGMRDGTGDAFKHYTDFMTTYGHRFRTFKHGAFHGGLAGVTIALPIVATSAMFEGRGFKNIAINAGYWIVCFMLMGAVICHFS